eukprot:scaffold18350_cov112-Isochrysis_galbana.AAC.3
MCSSEAVTRGAAPSSVARRLSSWASRPSRACGTACAARQRTVGSATQLKPSRTAQGVADAHERNRTVLFFEHLTDHPVGLVEGEPDSVLLCMAPDGSEIDNAVRLQPIPAEALIRRAGGELPTL